MSEPLLRLRDVHRTYLVGESPVHALQGVSLEIGRGEFVAIMGPSGSGKSSLMHILGLLDNPDRGEYLIRGENVGRLSEDEQAGVRNHVAGFVFQQFHLLRRMSIVDNVRLPHIYSGMKGDFREEALRSLQRVGLEHRLDHTPSQLSGGEQQRVAIARALIRDPMIIFADEPTGNLDSKNSREIMKILEGLHREGRTVVMVTHEDEIAAYADRVITMRDGRIVSDERRRPEAEPPEPLPVERGEMLHASRSLPVWRDGRFAAFARQAFQAILANKVRSFLSVLGIFVGVASVIAMMALGEGAKVSIEEEMKSLGSNLLSVRGGSAKIRGAARGDGAVARFTFRDVGDVAAMQGLVRRASGVVNGSARLVHGNRNWSTTLDGVGLEYGAMRATLPTLGRWFTPEEMRRRDKVAVIGLTAARELFGRTNPVGRTVKINRINFKIVGLAPPKGFSTHRDQDDIVYIPVTTAMYRVLGKDYLDRIYVEVESPEAIERTTEAITALIMKNHRLRDDDSFNIRDMTEIQEMLSSTTRTMGMLLGSIAAISLLVGGIGIMNIMLVSVSERTREIGLRKAIGARRTDIMLQFLVESVGMTLLGGLLGVLAGVGVSSMLALFAGWAVRTSLFSILLATLFSALVGMFFGLWPARKAAGLKPVEALRYE